MPNPGDVQSFDRYAYVNNNPLRYTDPTGHDPCDNGAACGEPSYSPATQALYDAFMQAEHGDYTWEMFYADLQAAMANAGGLQSTNYHTYPDLMAQAYKNRFGESGASASPKMFFFILFNPNEVAAGIMQEENQRVSALTGVLVGLAAQKMAAGALGGPCSFANDTLVATADGPKPITAVEEGELIYAYNEATGEVGLYPVTAELAHLDTQIVTLVINGERIVTTPEHPFYTNAYGWVPAGALQVGDENRRANDSVGTVQSMTVAKRPQVMYNLTVAEAHTFFVGDGQWLVHNQCSKKGAINAVGLPTKGRIRFVPPEDWNPTQPLPRGPNYGYVDRFDNEWVKGPSRTAGQPYEWDVQLSRTGRSQLGWLSRDGQHLNVSLDGHVTHK